MNLRLMSKLVLAVALYAGPLSAQELIYIDPGHTLEAPGVIGTCGTREVWVNDQLSLKLARLLQAGGYRVQFSRLPNTDVSKISQVSGREPKESLNARGTRANALKARLFISIHHDAIIESSLVKQPDACPENNTADSLVISPAILQKYQVGFNVFIHSAAGAKFNSSAKLARLIGQGFLDLKQTPSNFHVVAVEPDCVSCKFVDAKKGVMSRNLGVLRTPTMPAVLVEVTNLRIAEFERNANDPVYQDAIAQTLKQAVDQFFGKVPTQ